MTIARADRDGIPVSAGALIFDRLGRLLILKPTYKSGWTLPGGIMEPDGESPWDACRREVREETGLTVESGRLACVDTRPAHRSRPLGVRFLFDCGPIRDRDAARIVLQAEEVSEHRFVPVEEALLRLRPAIRRRVAAALSSPTCCYLENGRPVTALTGQARPARRLTTHSGRRSVG